MCATADSFLDLDISCVLVVDDRRTDLICCFLMRYGSLFPTSWVYSTVFYGFSPSSSLSFFVFFSFSAYHLFVYGILFFLPTFIYLLFHDRPLSSSVEIDASVFLESLFGDNFGAFAWSMVIDWSFFFLEYGSLMEFDDGWIGHLFLRGSSDD